MSGDMSLHEAKEWLRERVGKGAHCPCCTQYTRVYKRTITGNMAASLIALYREHLQRGDFTCYIHFESQIKGQPRYRHLRGGDYAKLRYWGLIEPGPSNDMAALPETKSAGLWRITDNGAWFVRGITTAPKYAHEFDARCLKLSGPERGVRECLGVRFNYSELMGHSEPEGEDD